MRCPECQQEVVLARTCPYCGAAVPQSPEAERPQGQGEDHPRGRFQGRLESGERSADADAREGRGGDRVPQGGFFSRLARYMMHSQVPVGSKLLVILAALYLISPLDLVPAFFPVGWLDDLGLLGAVWFWLTQEFKRYL